jgi:hypothetical protein
LHQAADPLTYLTAKALLRAAASVPGGQQQQQQQRAIIVEVRAMSI